MCANYIQIDVEQTDADTRIMFVEVMSLSVERYTVWEHYLCAFL